MAPEASASASLVNNSRSLREMSGRGGRGGERPPAPGSNSSLPNNNNRRGNAGSGGIQRMNKTQDVEQWIRHATVVQPQQSNPCGESKKRSSAESQPRIP